MKAARTIAIDQLIDNLPEYYSLFDRDQVQRAYDVAAEAHAEQKRLSGEPYINHGVAVAAILSEMKVPAEVVCAGLLHGAVEDKHLTSQELREQFGGVIVDLVDGVTKLGNLSRTSHTAHGDDDAKTIPLTVDQSSERNKQLTIETMRKTFLALSDDIRVVLIKLADCLHNMRTLGFAEPEKQKRIAQETLDIYAPLANRLGIWQIKWELEDLSFRYINPQKHKEIAERISDPRRAREEQIDEIIEHLSKVLTQAGVKVEISGRPKHIYSIYRKMLQKRKTFEMVQDVRGVRLIVSDVPVCYTTLGIVHNHWRPIPGEFDDYIAAPKDNFYQSLHTTVIYDDGKPLEVQIRTTEMHQNAEFGNAAHWRYKEGRTNRDTKYEQLIQWLRSMLEWKQDENDSQEFVDSMKSDVFAGRVYVFTPKGDIIDLQAESTPVDFAYHVHTDIGHRCRGAKIDGKLVPLDHILKTGEQVEIFTTKHGGPSRDWLNLSSGFVKTQRARSKIRSWFKNKETREKQIICGHEILEHERQRLGLKNINLENLARELKYQNIDEILINLSLGNLTLNTIVNLLSGEELPSENPDLLNPSAE